MVVHKDIQVYGKVQGVFFRKNTETKAFEFGIKGIVCNKPDGSVYIEAEGEEEQMEKFISWCRTGPLGAIVRDIDIHEGVFKNYTGFKIMRG